MDDERFWGLVAEARAHAASVEGRATWLVASLVKLAPREVERWGQCFDRAMAQAYRWDLWGVATLLHQGHEDEERFADFRGWIVSLGREAFEAALADPDTLADHLVAETPEARAYLRIARTAYEKLTGNELPMTTMDLFASPFGKPIAASELATRFPRIAALRA